MSGRSGNRKPKPIHPSPSDKLAVIELKLRELECQIKALFIALKEISDKIIASNANSNYTTRQDIRKLIKQILTETLDDKSPAIQTVVEWFDRQGYSFVKRLDNKEPL